MMAKAMLSLVSSVGGNARLSVLIFHRVLPQPDPLFPGEVDVLWFDKMLGWIAKWFCVLPLDEAVMRLRTSTLPARSAAITFDDGYADNYHVALPCLLKHQLSATFFVATGFLNGGRMWNDGIIEAVRHASGSQLNIERMGLGRHDLSTSFSRRAAIAALIARIKYLDFRSRQEAVERLVAHVGAPLTNDLMMTSDEVRSLRKAGMLIGAHTINHPILSRISSGEARYEIEHGKASLEGILGEPVSFFAYPNGKPDLDYRAEHVAMVREAGFQFAMTTARGAAEKSQDIFQMPRFTPWDRSSFSFGLRLAHNLLHRDLSMVNGVDLYDVK